MNADYPMPLHIQLKQLIQAEIQAGKYVEKIPSERELMERFHVSRSTVRESINHLVRDQVLEKVHGKGTFIKKRATVHEWLNALHSFTETVRNMGMMPSVKLLMMQDNLQDKEAQAILQSPHVFTFARLRKADDQPIAIERHYYEQSLGNQLKQYDLHHSTIYDLLEQQLHISLVEAEQTIKVVPITTEDAQHLLIEKNTNVLCVERVITGLMGEPIEFYRSIFHPELYELKLKTKR